MSGQHTQGWRVSAGDEHTVFDRGQSVLCRIACGGMSGRTFDEAAQIARLIAAAPDLLEALEEAVDVLDGMNDDEINVEFLPRLRATLAKAKGGAA